MPTFWTPCTLKTAVTQRAEQAEQGGVRVRHDCLLWRLEVKELQRSGLVNSVKCAECVFCVSRVGRHYQSHPELINTTCRTNVSPPNTSSSKVEHGLRPVMCALPCKKRDKVQG